MIITTFTPFQTTLESGIDEEQEITVGPRKCVKKNRLGHEQNVQIYVTKNPSNLKTFVEPGKNSKI